MIMVCGEDEGEHTTPTQTTTTPTPPLIGKDED
jgi:hypothetical protein